MISVKDLIENPELWEKIKAENSHRDECIRINEEEIEKFAEELEKNPIGATFCHSIKNNGPVS